MQLSRWLRAAGQLFPSSHTPDFLRLHPLTPEPAASPTEKKQRTQLFNLLHTHKPTERNPSNSAIVTPLPKRALYSLSFTPPYSCADHFLQNNQYFHLSSLPNCQQSLSERTPSWFISHRMQARTLRRAWGAPHTKEQSNRQLKYPLSYNLSGCYNHCVLCKARAFLHTYKSWQNNINHSFPPNIHVSLSPHPNNC